MNILFEVLRYVTLAINTVQDYIKLLQDIYFDVKTNDVRRYFLSDEDEFDESYTRVPENAVYIEEWVNAEGDKLCYVKYEGEEINSESRPNPFSMPTFKAKCPWVWVGDENTEIDLTRTFNKFLIPGNVIRLDLVQKLIHITENTKLIYITSKTFESKKFPGDGILIEEDV